MRNVVELATRWEEAEPRHIAPADWQRYERYVGEILSALGMELNTPGTHDTPQRFLQAMFEATAGYDGDPKLRTAFPAERPAACRGCPQPDRRGADLVLRAVRAPCAAVPRRRARRVRRRPGDPRHLEADTPRPPVRPPVHGAGAARRADRGRARRARRASRRRGAPGGGAPVHADARRRRGGLADGDDLLAWRVRRGRGPAPGVPRTGARPLTPLELLDERPGLPEWELPAELRRLYGGPSRPARAVPRRELRADARRRRRDPGPRALERARLRRERGRPLSRRAAARVRRRRARRLAHAARVAGRARGGPSGSTRRPRPRSPSCAACAAGRSVPPSRC